MARKGLLGRIADKVRPRRGRGGVRPDWPSPDAPEADGAAADDGRPTFTYAPDLDGDADPGEVVWTWVPYEEDPTQGKDRPVLVLGRDEDELVCVPLSSKDHDGRRDAADWIEVGVGGWDRAGRPSYADAARLLRVKPADVRREGAILDRARFDRVADRVRVVHGWG